MEPIPVILDCDNTMGLPGCDVDDGLALLYLLGCPQARLLGITCSFGNSTQDKTYPNTRKILTDWGRTDIPVFRGACAPGSEASPAAVFLAEQAQEHKHQLRLIVTGSTANLAGALALDPEFLTNLRNLTFMGGLTEPLYVGGKPMGELNLSIDSASSLTVLRQGHHISIATAQNCLDSHFPAGEYRSILEAHPGPLSRYLQDALEPWFQLNRDHWDLDGFVNWDVMAAAMVMHPELFHWKEETISPDEASLARGYLYGAGPELPVFLPVIRDRVAYRRHVYETCFSANVQM